MATLREYFDADFAYAAKLYVRLRSPSGLEVDEIEAAVLYDFSAFTAFFSCYVAGTEHDLKFFIELVKNIEWGKTEIHLDKRVFLPSARAFPGQLRVENKDPFDMLAQFHGDPEWISIRNIQGSRRIFIYSESVLKNDEIMILKEVGRKHGHEIQFRSREHASMRSRNETPKAFICHDSRDKIEVARKIAFELQRLMCPVWYDEFSLNVGDNLRTSIENGLKNCEKCIIILSPRFFTNSGWTKREFDSIFTRELLEEKGLILPVWYGVTKKEVYDYSPSLLNVKGLDWIELGETEVCRRLAQIIIGKDY